jgi:hypothetical protein
MRMANNNRVGARNESLNELVVRFESRHAQLGQGGPGHIRIDKQHETVVLEREPRGAEPANPNRKALGTTPRIVDGGEVKIVNHVRDDDFMRAELEAEGELP